MNLLNKLFPNHTTGTALCILFFLALAIGVAIYTPISLLMFDVAAFEVVVHIITTAFFALIGFGVWYFGEKE